MTLTYIDIQNMTTAVGDDALFETDVVIMKQAAKKTLNVKMVLNALLMELVKILMSALE
jgi:hypothetical protein